MILRETREPIIIGKALFNACFYVAADVGNSSSHFLKFISVDMMRK